MRLCVALFGSAWQTGCRGVDVAVILKGVASRAISSLSARNESGHSATRQATLLIVKRVLQMLPRPSAAAL